MPSPPGCAPAPPLPSPQACSGAPAPGSSRSSASTGVSSVFVIAVCTPLMPGAPAGRPAHRRPSRSTPSRRRPRSRLFIVPWPAAPTSVGRGLRERAQAHVGDALAHLDVPRADGDGRDAATTVPAGAITRTGRMAPPFAGIVGSVADAERERDRAHRHRLDRVHVARPLRRRAGEVERGGVAGDRDRDARSVRASAGAGRGPAESSTSVNVVAAVGEPRAARRACAARRSRRSRRTSSVEPSCATTSRTRSTPSAFAPRCASRSPRRSSGVRDALDDARLDLGVEQRRRDAQTLLVDHERVGRHRTRGRPAEVGVVRPVRDPRRRGPRRRSRARRA